MPNYKELTEDQFQKEFCYSRNSSSVTPTGHTFGYGRLLGNYKLTVPPPSGLYLEGAPLKEESEGSGPKITLQEIVVLTDNQTFAVIFQTWTGLDECSWAVVTPDMNDIAKKTKDRIEDFAASAGFKKEHFVFLNYEKCGWLNDVL